MIPQLATSFRRGVQDFVENRFDPLKVSVIVATCNRAESLRQMLESFEAMGRSCETAWELVLVDNNSTDATRSVVEEVEKRGEIPLVHVFEGRQGKPLALNAGLRRASGQILAFTDDDCRVAAGWVDAVAREFVDHPDLDGLGGRVELYDPADLPVATRTLRRRARLSSPAELYHLLIGCNMALRRSVLDEIGDFDPLVGPGAAIPSGNDVDILYRTYRAGFRIEYSPEVLVRHHHGRQTQADVAAANRRYLIGRGAFYAKYVARGDLRVLRLAAAELLTLGGELLRSALRGESPAPLLQRLRYLGRGFRTRLARTPARNPSRASPS